MTNLAGASQAPSAGGVAPQASVQDQPGALARGPDDVPAASGAARSAGQGESPVPTSPSSRRSGSQPAGSQPAGSRTTPAPQPSGGRVLAAGGEPERPAASEQGSVTPDQPSPATPRTATREAPPAAPAPRTPSSGTSSRAIPAGSNLSLRSDATICTNTHKVGQSFAAALTQDLKAADGTTIASGARAVIEITQLKRSEEAGDPITMGFRVSSVSHAGRVFYVNAPAHSASIARVRRPSRTSDATKVAAGAALGAAVGQAVGKDTKSTLTGAAAGAAVGAAAAEASASYEGCVPTGGRINATVAE